MSRVSAWEALPSATTYFNEMGVLIGSLAGGSTPASAAYPNANDALLTPLYLEQFSTIKRLFVLNGAVVSGNIDIGIYTQGGAKIVSSGSTVQSGTSSNQIYDVTNFSLGPGRYYLAMALDNVTGRIVRAGLSTNAVKLMGMARMTSAFPLPNQITFMPMTSGYLPVMGIELGSIII